MKIDTDPKAWLEGQKRISSKSIRVKRSDLDVFKNGRSHGILAQPTILHSEVKNDEQLFDYVRVFAAGDPVIVVGHGWNQTEQFVAQMTVKEFIQHWQGD